MSPASSAQVWRKIVQAQNLSFVIQCQTQGVRTVDVSFGSCDCPCPRGNTFYLGTRGQDVHHSAHVHSETSPYLLVVDMPADSLIAKPKNIGMS